MNIAIFPSAGLGDGIIQLLLAQNLARLGINVDFYHHYLADLNNIVQHVNVFKSNEDIYQGKLKSYDVLLADSGSKGLDLSGLDLPIKRKLAKYTMGRIAPYSFSKKRRLYNSSFIAPNITIDNKMIDLNCFNGRSLRSSRYLGLSTAGHIVRFLKTNKLVDAPRYKLDLSLPVNWVNQKFRNRILIHPTSTSKNKNWLSTRYIELALHLKQKGFNPVFSVSPSEKVQWTKILKGQFEVPIFENISHLGQYYHESLMLIGNDSGNGHLASALGLPTITLVNRRPTNFDWRPNWSTNIIVNPLLSRRLVGNHYWKYTLSLDSVLTAFYRQQLNHSPRLEPITHSTNSLKRRLLQNI